MRMVTRVVGTEMLLWQKLRRSMRLGSYQGGLGLRHESQ